MRSARYLFVVPLLCGALAGLWIVARRYDYPDLTPYWQDYELPAATGGTGPVVRWFGASTLLIEDGEHRILVDGFFTRPPKPFRIELGVHLRPNRRLIAQRLRDAGAKRIDAIFVLHGHYDHAMDAPEVARLTGARILGSRSVANIARGAGLPEDRITVVQSGQPVAIGAFELVAVPSAHAPTMFARSMPTGTIDKPLAPGATAADYRAGTAYALVVRHPRGNLLVVGSSGFVPGALAPYRAEAALLSTDGLARMSRSERLAYFRETAGAVGARIVIPIHWDDTTRPLQVHPWPQPRLFDDVPEAFEALLAWTRQNPERRFGLLPALLPVSLFDLVDGPDTGRP